MTHTDSRARRRDRGDLEIALVRLWEAGRRLKLVMTSRGECWFRVEWAGARCETRCLRIQIEVRLTLSVHIGVYAAEGGLAHETIGLRRTSTMWVNAYGADAR